jgi:hypothetical protein
MGLKHFVVSEIQVVMKILNDRDEERKCESKKKIVEKSFTSFLLLQFSVFAFKMFS